MNKTPMLLGILALLLIGGAAYWAFTDRPTPTPYVPAETQTAEMQTATQTPVVTSGENPQTGSAVHDLPVEPAAAAARKSLAAKLGVSEKSIVIIKITEKTWNDGCLGLGGADESCLQALVPGFKVEMLAKGETYIYRTDKTGIALRAEH